MSERTDIPIDRREMGRTVMRWMLACGIGAGGAAICLRESGDGPRACNEGSCLGCGSIAQCNLPQAVEARKAAR